MTQEWIKVNLPLSLALEIDRVIEKARTFGVNKYSSRSDFAKIACISALAMERKNNAKLDGRKMEAIAK